METISLLALLVVIIVSCVSRTNPGLIALGFAWILGSYGAHISLNQIASGFPAYLFIMLIGVTYLFGIAQHNGTLERISHLLLKVVKKNSTTAPILFFLLAALLSTVGAGNIGAVALLAPIAMLVARTTGISAFFMTIFLICGANAGAFSPFSLTGIIANGLIAKLGISMTPWIQVYLPNLLAQSFLAGLSYIIFYLQLQKHNKTINQIDSTEPIHIAPWTRHQKQTLTAIIILIISTLLFKTDVGFLSLALACLLTLLNEAEAKESIKHIPWNTILMVCGVNTLIVLIENLGGLGLLTDLLAKISNPQNVTAVTAFTTGVLSAFSSSSGVVLPTFIPLVPELITKIQGGNPVAIISSINVGAHLVDISPLSSLGAICIASAIHEDKDKLFRQLMIFGLSMAVVGAVLCYLLFGWMR